MTTRHQRGGLSRRHWLEHSHHLLMMNIRRNLPQTVVPPDRPRHYLSAKLGKRPQTSGTWGCHVAKSAVCIGCTPAFAFEWRFPLCFGAYRDHIIVSDRSDGRVAVTMPPYQSSHGLNRRPESTKHRLHKMRLTRSVRSKKLGTKAASTGPQVRDSKTALFTSAPFFVWGTTVALVLAECPTRGTGPKSEAVP